MLKKSPFTTVIDINEWTPVFKGSRVLKARINSAELRVSLRKFKQEKNPKLTLSIGSEVMNILNCGEKERLLLMNHPEEIHHFLLVKSATGNIPSVVKAKHGTSYRMMVSLHHPTLKNIESQSVEYSIHPNNTITFYLKNSAQ